MTVELIAANRHISSQRYRADRKLRRFSCWDQWLCMAFAQLTHRQGLRDIEVCLRAVPDKLYHLGIRRRVSGSTLADANQQRDWRVFADLAQVLIALTRPLYANDPLAVGLDETVYAFDATTIDVCLALCPCSPFSCEASAWTRQARRAPFVATMVDVCGLIIYFGAAGVVLRGTLL